MPVIVRPSIFTSAVNRSPAFTTVPPRMTMPMRCLLSPPVFDQPHPGLVGVRVLVRFDHHVVVVEPGDERRHCALRVADLDASRGGHRAAGSGTLARFRARETLAARLGAEERRPDEQRRELVP